MKHNIRDEKGRFIPKLDTTSKPVDEIKDSLLINEEDELSIYRVSIEVRNNKGILIATRRYFTNVFDNVKKFLFE